MSPKMKFTFRFVKRKEPINSFMRKYLAKPNVAHSSIYPHDGCEFMACRETFVHICDFFSLTNFFPHAYLVTYATSLTHFDIKICDMKVVRIFFLRVECAFNRE